MALCDPQIPSKVHSKINPEIFYVQKLQFFLFLATLAALAWALTLLLAGMISAFFILITGLILSYFAMVRKKSFAPPAQRITAQRMAREIAQTVDPVSVSRFASQLYCYFHNPQQAITLLEKFQSERDPLLCITLGEILFKEGQPQQALHVLEDSPFAFDDPLLLAAQGHILRHFGKLPEAVNMYQRSLGHIRRYGLPKNGAPWFTHKLLNLSYCANMHHTLADCYYVLKNFSAAKREYRAGNRLLLDISLWRYRPGP